MTRPEQKAEELHALNRFREASGELAGSEAPGDDHPTSSSSSAAGASQSS